MLSLNLYPLRIALQLRLPQAVSGISQMDPAEVHVSGLRAIWTYWLAGSHLGMPRFGQPPFGWFYSKANWAAVGTVFPNRAGRVSV